MKKGDKIVITKTNKEYKLCLNKIGTIVRMYDTVFFVKFTLISERDNDIALFYDNNKNITMEYITYKEYLRKKNLKFILKNI